jgi:hypothetical protein
MRWIVIGAAIFCGVHAQAASVLRLSSDSTSYLSGGSAQLSAIALVSPSEPTQDLYIGSTLNGSVLSLVQTKNGFGSVSTGPLPEGQNIWQVQLYAEDSILAGQLNRTIDDLNLQDSQIRTELSQTSDPAQIITLENKLNTNLFIISEALNQLVQIRRPFGPAESLTFFAY